MLIHMKTSENPQIKRLVGAEGEMGAAFGLDNEWNLRIIKQVGNYGESYKRNIADTGIYQTEVQINYGLKVVFYTFHHQDNLSYKLIKRARFSSPFFIHILLHYEA